MNVEIVNPHNIAVPQPGKPYPSIQDVSNDNLDIPQEDQPAQILPATAQADQQQNDTEKTPGVIRLLQEGHFKGVADVRLRINFQQQLTQIHNSQLQSTADDKSDSVIDVVENGIDSLVETGAVTDEQMDAPMQNFSQAANQAKDEFVSSDSPSKETLANALSSAFDALSTSVNEILNQTDVDNDQTDIAQEIMDNLSVSFNAALDEFINSLNAANILPDLSQPSGNGVAYDKFLAIYNELNGFEPQDDDSQDNELLDVEA